ncbi:hypothetical protein PYW08_007843 [Mythimna loreyi]|uniref:Uncharacterized protein n=1 Tax=Mythimna loreyi TaxID=667449 RepID=A0ACC2QES9_9NEOP|nr:hypothetical protein PYW08_007843 [Mythimna loreyi]
MHDSYLLLLFVLSCNALRRSVLTNLKENDRTIKDALRSEVENTSVTRLEDVSREKNQDNEKNKKSTQKNIKTPEKDIPQDTTPFSKISGTTTSINEKIGRSHFHLDPVFDFLQNRRLWQKPKKERLTSSSSSELEMQFWLEDWAEKRQNQKIEAFNSTSPRKEVINMKMARPSGIPCGDPNQHDMPWGTCMRPIDCEEEYRILRGDAACGRSQYVCCAFVDTTYDMYQAPDMSFEHDNSLTTDSDIEKGYKDSHEEEKRLRLHRKHERSKRKRTKVLLKKKIRHSITKIIAEITKLLQKAYRNATSIRMRKTKDLMDFIREMKKQYRHDRESLVTAHEFDILKYDLALESSLKRIKGVNEAFLTNDTFREIIVNGTINTKALEKLKKTHPVLSLFFNTRRMGGDFEPEQTGKEEPELEKEKLDIENEEPRSEKEESESEEDESDIEIEEPRLEKEESESEEAETELEIDKPKVIDYDVEYGVLYY